ncbi:MAG: class II aldolase/adducin family protein, partial [Mariprofundaceae bacterium]|nr:class II aldolase/adducin family protein [Mariprofundaceae bacterium]
ISFMKSNHETEGVVKYQLDFEPGEAPRQDIRCLNVWRSILFELGLIGQDPARYQGYGFGNLSQRCADDPAHFIISASQTGYIARLEPGHYVEVLGCDIAHNRVQARGALPPSSEALTHAMFYQLDASIGAVIHVHAPKLWRYGLQHGYPASDAAVEYGTVAMAQEIARLYWHGDLSSRHSLMMTGHEDGVICFGRGVDQAALALLGIWLASQ